VTAAWAALPVILVTGSRGRVKVAEVVVVATLEVPLATRFHVLRRLRRAWQESCGEKKWPWTQVDASSFLRVSGSSQLAGQGDKAIGTLLQMISECSFVQIGHSLASAAPLKQRIDHKG
jgi:hypothetical protein